MIVQLQIYLSLDTDAVGRKYSCLFNKQGRSFIPVIENINVLIKEKINTLIGSNSLERPILSRLYTLVALNIQLLFTSGNVK